MKKRLLLIAAMLVIGTAGLSGCTHAQAGRTSDSTPDNVSRIVADEKPAPAYGDEDCDDNKCGNGDCRNGNCQEPDFEEAQPDENKIPEQPDRKYRKKRDGRRHGHGHNGHNSKSCRLPDPRRMPRKLK